jgi:flavin-dependent dehydrogenase
VNDVGVVVVGAGPAGSACALALARRGVPVTVVERQKFPRRKVCGEYLNGGAVLELDALGIGDAVRSVAHPLSGIRLVPSKLEALELAFGTEALACERALLDDLLLVAARDAGATIVRAHAEDLAYDGGRAAGVVVRDESGERRALGARFIVGADGAGSLVARKLGLARAPRGARKFAVGGHYFGLGELGAHIEMYVGSGAYFAINPLDERRCNVMVVVRDRDLAGWSSDVDEGLRGRAEQLGGGRRTFEGVQRVGPRVSVGPLAFEVSSAAGCGALVIGDAAGLLNPFTGQGVFLALRSAREAADALLAAFADPARETSAVARYAVRRARDFRMRKRLAKLVDLLIDVPLLAQRATARMRSRPEIAATLIAALSGTIKPEVALSPRVMGRLLL